MCVCVSSVYECGGCVYLGMCVCVYVCENLLGVCVNVGCICIVCVY